MTLKLFEFVEQFMMYTSLLKLSNLRKVDQKVRLLFRWEIW